ncbi:MAG TPA: response regulator [Thermoanaerobaculia bacterium]|nr:response regulator [Thermoanaerobaculia bacterium]
MSERPKILVIDDDQPLLLLMKNILSEFRFEALVASSGTQALAMARAENPELILIDKNMPGMSGEDVIRQLKADPIFRQIPILVLSGEPLSPRELAELGVQGSVQKPFDLNSLIAEIRSRLPRTAAKEVATASL